jgi:2-polyprenyl-3-methyl-5-hydroxy-6-metoxy-1,4-benzoquinol methylase
MTLATDAQGKTFRLEPWDCPTCGTAEKKFVGFRGGVHHRYGLGLASRIVRCASCTLMFADPFPIPVETSSLYGDPERFFENHDPVEHLKAHRELVRGIVERALVDSPEILDVGSGRGELLRAAAEAGLEGTVGLELSRAMVTYAQDHHAVRVLEETVEDHVRNVGEKKYDAIVLSAVLEHVHNPDTTIEAIRRLGRPGAILYIDIPQEPHLMTRIGSIPGWLTGKRTVLNLSPTFSPFHVYGFSQKALATLLTKHGFTIEERTVWASPKVPSGKGVKDKTAALAMTQINRLANRTGTASNQYVWARLKR